MKNLIRSLAAIIVVAAFFSCGGPSDSLEEALNLAGDNREELEKVLEHFKDDSLKYQAAKFLIENMPYHYAPYGKVADKYATAYIEMATEAKEFRDSVIKAKTRRLDTRPVKKISDIRKVDATFLIKAINDACDVWRKVAWSKDYDQSMFFNYVLPYRLFEEPLSDWHKTIKEEFPYIDKDVVYIVKGIQISASSEQIVKGKTVDSPSALRGQCVQMEKAGSSVTFNIQSPTAVKKLINFKYNTLAKDTKAVVVLNGKNVGTLVLEPTNSIYSFRKTRFGKVMDLKKGENILTVKYVNKPFCLDYIELASFEPYHDEDCIDYSTSFCQIQNVGTGSFASMDTLQASVYKPIFLRRYSAKDRNLNLRLDYLGYPCWKISPMDSINMCMEDRWVSLDTLAAVGKREFLNSNSGNIFQRWVFIPIGDGMYKIMNKYSGLFWESGKDWETGKEIIVQNVYSGKDSQKWKIIKKESNPYAQSLYKIGSILSYGLRVTEVMDQFEFVVFRGHMDPSLASLCKYRTGKCQDEASFTVALSRYLGIPTAVDFTPHWGNRPSDHTWSVLMQPNGKSIPFYMGRAPGDTVQFTNSYVKPKIFRRSFVLNRKIVDDLSEEESVPETFSNPHFVDVTDEYGETTDVMFKIPEGFCNHNVAYICVNEREDWIPVYYGNIKSGKVTFKSMGRNILYTVGIWEKDKIVPVGDPFIIQDDGSIRYLNSDYKRLQTMTLYRKYPFFGQFSEFNNRMSYGSFQGSNKEDFSDMTKLYEHEGVTEGRWYERKSESSRKTFKYLRYIGFRGSYCNVNEIEFYNSKDEKLTGKILGTQGMPGHTKETVFDGDVLTGFNGNSPDGHWVGLELEKPSDVAKIRYMPRNDGNSIEVGDTYQLLMFDRGKWLSLSVIKARGTELVFKKMPSGGLYLLKDLTKGVEERIFTYEDGKQIWW